MFAKLMFYSCLNLNLKIKKNKLLEINVFEKLLVDNQFLMGKKYTWKFLDGLLL